MQTPMKKRQKIVQEAIANQRLEGLVVSEEYIVSKLSAKEVAAKIRARYGAAV